MNLKTAAENSVAVFYEIKKRAIVIKKFSSFYPIKKFGYTIENLIV